MNWIDRAGYLHERGVLIWKLFEKLNLQKDILLCQKWYIDFKWINQSSFKQSAIDIDIGYENVIGCRSF